MMQNVFGGIKKRKKHILPELYYKPRCSKPGEKVTAYSPEFTVGCFFFVCFSIQGLCDVDVNS